MDLSHRGETYSDLQLILLARELCFSYPWDSSQGAVRSWCARFAFQSVIPTTDASAREFISKIFAASVFWNPKIRGMSRELEAKTERHRSSSFGLAVFSDK